MDFIMRLPTRTTSAPISFCNMGIQKYWLLTGGPSEPGRPGRPGLP